MYKLLLCWRYLCTRYLTMVCIVSIMLGVATLIVVNSVMGGFSKKLKDRLHALLSDIVIESTAPIDGFPAKADEMMERIRKSPAGPDIAAMAPSVEIFAIMEFSYNGTKSARMVKLVGVDPKLQKEVGGFAEYLQEPDRRANPSFDLPPDVLEHYRQRSINAMPLRQPAPPPDDGDVPGLPRIGGTRKWEQQPPPDAKLDGPPERFTPPRGIVLGHLLAHTRVPKPEGGFKEYRLRAPGDEVMIYTIGTGNLEPVFDRFVVCDYVKSEMSEYDGMFVYVPLDHLQHLRTMEGRVNTIQIRLKDYSKAAEVKQQLTQMFSPYDYSVQTWEDKQGPLLAAISIERGILNILLFMIIGVAGFGILAIFSMIVSEKTRDIGILKSLGASHWGVLKIFTGFALLLGTVGCALGTGLGLLITYNINEIEKYIAEKTGRELFDRSLYYFNEIPTEVDPMNIFLILLGAMFIALLSSLVPAIKASRMHPVNALRFE